MVKDDVREAVYQQRSQELYEQWIKDLWANAYVEIKSQIDKINHAGIV
jgi:hypothetical protein